MSKPAPPDATLGLPPQFLADEELFMGKGKLEGKGLNTELTPSRLDFPNEFPYEFHSPSFSPAFSSPGDSTETEESSDDEEDFLAGLTRRLALSTQRVPVASFTHEKFEEKSRVLPSSPQSTLTEVGSWFASGHGSPNGPSSQVPSPPTTPSCNKDGTWDAIYAAAGHVARLKMSTESSVTHQNPSSRTLLRPTTSDPALLLGKAPNDDFYFNHGVTRNFVRPNQLMKHGETAKQQCFSVWGRQTKGLYNQAELKYQYPEQPVLSMGGGILGCESGTYGRPLPKRQSAWPTALLPQHLPPCHSTAVAVRGSFLAGSGAKRRSGGTGVFLPRTFTNRSDSRKKSGCSSVLLPAKPVQAVNLNFDDMSRYSQPQPQFASQFGVSNYDHVLARRNALLAQQRRSLRPVGVAFDQEQPLPQEWMY